MKKAEEIIDGLNEQRLLIFLETEPQSNKYHQVILDPVRFKNVSAHIGKNLLKTDEDGLEHWEVEESEDVYDLPDLQSFINLEQK